MKSHLNIPTLLITSLVIRVLYCGSSIGEAIALASLTGLYGFHLYLNYKVIPTANKDLWDRLISLEESHKGTRDKINAVQLSNTFKK